MKQPQKTAPLLVILAGICWGIIGLFSRQLSARGMSAVQVTAVRCFVTAFCMLLFLLVHDRAKLRIALRDLPLFLGTGLLSIVFFNVCYFKTIEISSLSVASVLLYTAPAMVTLISLFVFKERMTLAKGLALCLSFFGCILLTGLLSSSTALSLPGILLGLGSGLGYALYSIFGRLALRKYHPFTLIAYTFFVASAGLLPFCGALKIVEIAVQDNTALLFMLLLGLVSTLIPFLLYTKGLQHMEAGKAAIMAFIEPLVATLCGILFFQEQLTPMNLCGILLIFISVILLHLPISPRGPRNT